MFYLSLFEHYNKKINNLRVFTPKKLLKRRHLYYLLFYQYYDIILDSLEPSKNLCFPHLFAHTPLLSKRCGQQLHRVTKKNDYYSTLHHSAFGNHRNFVISRLSIRNNIDILRTQWVEEGPISA